MFKISYKFILNVLFFLWALGLLYIRYIEDQVVIDTISVYDKISGVPFDNPETGLESKFSLIFLISLMALASVILPFIGLSRFKNIKWLSRSEKSTPGFIRTLISMGLGYLCGQALLMYNIEYGNSLLWDISVPIGIALMLFARLMYKEKPSKDIPVIPEKDVQMAIDESYDFEQKEETVVTRKPKKKVRRTYTGEDIELASFIRRMFAAIVDFLLAFILWILGTATIGATLSMFLYPDVDPGGPESDEIFNKLMPACATLFMIFITWFYYALFESSSRGATPGKMLFKIKVTDFDGNNISFWRASKRILLKHIMFLISFLIIPIWAFIMAAFHDKRQAFHDIFAKTLVVRK